MTRLAAVVAIIVVVLLATAAPASAHGGKAVKASSYVTELIGLDRAVPGVTVRLVDEETRLELDAGDHDVVVLGYEDEPYLRVGADGVFRNLRSPSTYLNQSINGNAPPADADSKAEPEWQRIGDGPTVRWHDHALHVPPGLTTGLRTVSEWARPIEIDGERAQIKGRIVTLPGQSRLPWMALAALLAVAVIVGARLAWKPVLLGALALLVAADAARIYGIVWGAPVWLVSRWRLFTDVANLSIVGWGMAIAAVVLLSRRRRLEAAAAAAMSGCVLAVAGGLLELGDLAAANLTTATPDVVARAVVAVVLGVGLGVLVSAALELARPRVTPDRVIGPPRPSS